MKPNMGALDRLIRMIIAAIFIILIIARSITGISAIIFGILALVFVVTSLISFCPLYMPFKISTIVKKEKSKSKK